MAAERQLRLHHTIMHGEAGTEPKSAHWMQFVLVGKWGRPGCILTNNTNPTCEQCDQALGFTTWVRSWSRSRSRHVFLILGICVRLDTS
jgi:hypothetical protein